MYRKLRQARPKQRRTASKVIAAWRGRAVVGGRRRARFATRSAAVQQWPPAWCGGRCGGSAAFLGHIALSQTTFALWSLGRGAFTILLAPLSVPGPGLRCHGDDRTPPTRFDLPGREEPVYIATQRGTLEPWEGQDPPSLAAPWATSPSSPSTEAGRAPSWLPWITCEPMAGRASG
jgi:hypothetical protein